MDHTICSCWKMKGTMISPISRYTEDAKAAFCAHPSACTGHNSTCVRIVPTAAEWQFHL